MRAFIFLSVAVGITLACNAPVAAPPLGPLDGAWKLDSATSGAPPRQMTLTQRGTSVTGTGAAMGVDVPIPIAISGSSTPATRVSPFLVQLLFSFQNGGGITAAFSGILGSDGRLAGSVVYYGITDTSISGRLVFRRP